MEKKEEETLVIVLIGRLGVGKSATANYLSQTTAFQSQRSSTAITLASQHAQLPSSNATPTIVVDTPGLGNPEVTREQVHTEIFDFLRRIDQDYVNCRFALVFVLGVHTRLTDDDLKEFGLLGTIFGLNFYEHSFNIWTHSDLLPDEATAFDDFTKDNGDSMSAFLRDVQKGDPLLLNTTAAYDANLAAQICGVARAVAVPLKGISMKEMKGKRARRMRQAELRKKGQLSTATPDQGFFSSLYAALFGDSSETSKPHIV